MTRVGPEMCFSQSDTQKGGTIFQPRDHSDRVVFRLAGRTCLPKKSLSVPSPRDCDKGNQNQY